VFFKFCAFLAIDAPRQKQNLKTGSKYQKKKKNPLSNPLEDFTLLFCKCVLLPSFPEFHRVSVSFFLMASLDFPIGLLTVAHPKDPPPNRAFFGSGWVFYARVQ